jgi:pyruvate/2-oxoacid:ferredoxin oxidoreductase beta subunit
MRKVQRGARHKGPAYLELLSPCPTGWGFDPAKTVEYSRKAVETAAWPIYEIIEGKLALSHIPKRLRPLEDYLMGQERFKGLPRTITSRMQDHVFEEWKWLLEHNGKRMF